jgi:hypothetical protein
VKRPFLDFVRCNVVPQLHCKVFARDVCATERARSLGLPETDLAVVVGSRLGRLKLDLFTPFRRVALPFSTTIS